MVRTQPIANRTPITIACLVIVLSNFTIWNNYNLYKMGVSDTILLSCFTKALLNRTHY